jgi:hypothetical protein
MHAHTCTVHRHQCEAFLRSLCVAVPVQTEMPGSLLPSNPNLRPRSSAPPAHSNARKGSLAPRPSSSQHSPYLSQRPSSPCRSPPHEDGGISLVRRTRSSGLSSPPSPTGSCHSHMSRSNSPGRHTSQGPGNLRTSLAMQVGGHSMHSCVCSHMFFHAAL